MYCWPECPVRETIIIFPTIKWRQVQEHVLDIFFVDYSGQRTAATLPLQPNQSP
jgi:hypothetical protein